MGSLLHKHKQKEKKMLSTNELESSLRLLNNSDPGTDLKNICWKKGATDILNLLIRKSQEKEDSQPHYSF